MLRGLRRDPPLRDLPRPTPQRGDGRRALRGRVSVLPRLRCRKDRLPRQPGPGLRRMPHAPGLEGPDPFLEDRSSNPHSATLEHLSLIAVAWAFLAAAITTSYALAWVP